MGFVLTLEKGTGFVFDLVWTSSIVVFELALDATIDTCYI